MISLEQALRLGERLPRRQSTPPSTPHPFLKVSICEYPSGAVADWAIVLGLSRPTVPETIDEDKSDDEVEEGAADPTAQAIYNLVHGTSLESIQ